MVEKSLEPELRALKKESSSMFGRAAACSSGRLCLAMQMERLVLCRVS